MMYGDLPRARHPGVWSQVGFRKHFMNKARGGDGISVELSQILKDDAVKVQRSVCQQIWKILQWPQDWTRSVFILIPMKGNAKGFSNYCTAAAAAAKSLQSCPTLCDPRDGSPPGSPVPGILQARTWVGCHFLLQCMKVKVKLLSCVRLLSIPWTAAYQAPPSMGFSRQEYWSGMPLPSPNYCTIVLISHAIKIIFKILQARLQQYMNWELQDVQSVFRKGRGTRDQIANICWITKQENLKKYCFCFIDYAKAFDYVEHSKLGNILKKIGLPDHITCLLRNVYAGQEAIVRSGHGTTDWFQIGKEVHQGCILSPCLFNLYAEYIVWNTGLDDSHQHCQENYQQLQICR